MLGLKEVQDSILKELDVCDFLVGKITSEIKDDYTLGDNMWSLKELLQTLSFIGVYTLEALRDGDFIDKTHTRYKKMTKEAEQVNRFNFVQANEKQKQAIQYFFESLPQERLDQKAVHPLIKDLSLQEGIIEVSLKFLTGYRMQLFLYLKSAGLSDLNGANCWSGIEEPYFSYRKTL